MISFLYNRFKDKVNEESFRRLLRKNIKNNNIDLEITYINELIKNPIYKELPYYTKDYLEYLPNDFKIFLYKKQEYLYALGIPDCYGNIELLENLNVYSYRYYEDFIFIFVAARSEKEAIDIIEEHINRTIDKDCLNLVDNAKIETIPRIIEMLRL